MVSSTQWPLRLDPLTGRPESLVSTCTDLSTLSRTQRALSRSDARLRRAQEASGVIAFEIPGDRRIVTYPAFRSLFGLSADTPLTLERCLARFHPTDRASALHLHARLSEAGGGFRLEFLVAPPDGRTRWWLARGEAAARPDCGLHPPMVTGVILDVTERRAAEVALAESEERLRLTQGAVGFESYDYDIPTGHVTWDRWMRAFWSLHRGHAGDQPHNPRRASPG